MIRLCCGLLVLLISLNGCQLLPVGDASRPEVRGDEAGEYGLHLRLSCDRDSVLVKEDIPIHVFLENPSKRAIRATHPKYNRFGSFRVIVTDSGGARVLLDFADSEPYFYGKKPTLRRGAALVPVEVTDEDGICTLPPGLVWEGRIGTTLVVCGAEDSSYSEPCYLSFRDPGTYTIRVDYVFDRAEAQARIQRFGDSGDVSEVPELVVQSNALSIRVRPGPEKKP